MSAFGYELRRLRTAAGLSLQGLSQVVHYNKGYLSRVETGERTPTTQLARACDDALGTDGRLTELLRGTAAPSAAAADPSVAAAEGACLPVLPPAADPSWAQPLSDVLGATRALGQRAPVRTVLPPMLAQLRTLSDLTAPPGDGRHLLGVYARFAEYTGWLYQETDDRVGSARWNAQARQLARRVGDDSLAAYTVVRDAELAMYSGDAAMTIRYAQLAQHDPAATAQTRVLAAHREAQGHALAYDADRMRAALDQALAWQESGTEAAGHGSRSVGDPHAVTAGWCHYELGRYRHAADQLERGWNSISPDSRRMRAIIGSRLALAHLGSPDLDRACEVGREALRLTLLTESATARGQLRLLARELHRRRGHPPAAALYTELTTLLPR
ncbi:transcriptional regulator [Catellatospora sp. TT07R-123]|uniref:helix-turn-helix domain-containing protein n=1 Tax=Catellatospora sp. TT07R-123 TaxID=2733863 RepID=UPI001B20CA99|nr:helix-turn-helix transcriptional regulator [Catellatospora sp. TT07R-123]GHJ43558.1 transcriptional regulator [Catellatospora sp. TT07R-123]